MAYKVIISDEVTQAIDSIHDYITTVLLSPQSAKNTVSKILDGLKSSSTKNETLFFYLTYSTQKATMSLCYRMVLKKAQLIEISFFIL